MVCVTMPVSSSIQAHPSCLPAFNLHLSGFARVCSGKLVFTVHPTERPLRRQVVHRRRHPRSALASCGGSLIRRFVVGRRSPRADSSATRVRSSYNNNENHIHYETHALSDLALLLYRSCRFFKKSAAFNFFFYIIFGRTLFTKKKKFIEIQ